MTTVNAATSETIANGALQLSREFLASMEKLCMEMRTQRAEEARQRQANDLQYRLSQMI